MIWLAYIFSACSQPKADDSYLFPLSAEPNVSMITWLIPASFLVPALIAMSFAYLNWRKKGSAKRIMLQLGGCVFALLAFIGLTTRVAIKPDFSFAADSFNATSIMMTGNFMVSVALSAALVMLCLCAVRLGTARVAQEAMMAVATLSVIFVTFGWAVLNYAFANCL